MIPASAGPLRITFLTIAPQQFVDEARALEMAVRAGSGRRSS